MYSCALGSNSQLWKLHFRRVRAVAMNLPHVTDWVLCLCAFCSCEQRMGVVVFTRQPTGRRGSDAGSKRRSESCRWRRRNRGAKDSETDQIRLGGFHCTFHDNIWKAGKEEQKKVGFFFLFFFYCLCCCCVKSAAVMGWKMQTHWGKEKRERKWVSFHKGTFHNKMCLLAAAWKSSDTGFYLSRAPWTPHPPAPPSGIISVSWLPSHHWSCLKTFPSEYFHNGHS